MDLSEKFRLSPSKEDAMFTRRLAKAGDLLGIPLIEHLIVTPEKTYYSFRLSQPDIFTIDTPATAAEGGPNG